MVIDLLDGIEINMQAILWTLVGVVVAVLSLMLFIRWAIRWVHRLLARRAHELDRAQMQARWKRILTLLHSPDRQVHKLAIMEADTLLDFVLKAMHLPGETMAFRLKFAQNKFYELKRVRWAHALRNNVVHEPDFLLKKSQAQAAIKEYERALKLLGAL